MTGAWVAVALILVGLPLLAWWVSRRPVWSRLRPGAGPDAYGDMLRRHRLTAGDVTTVRQAMADGGRLDDPRLRAAVLDWAQQELGGGRPPVPVWVRLLGVAWLTVFVVHMVLLIAQGRWGDVNWVTIVIALGGGVWLRRRRTRLRRAVQLNSGPPGGGETGQRE